MLLLADATFAVTDAETTGLSPERNRVTEIACVHVRGGAIIQEYHSLVNPEQHIPNEIQKMTGITNAMVFAADKGDIVFPRVRQWIPDDAIFVGQNVSFDYDFLQHAYRRHGVDEMKHRRICTARLARRVLPARKRWSLSQLAAYFGIKVVGRHRALGDAYATAKIFIELLDILQEEHHCESVEDLLSIQYRTVGSFKETPPHILALEPVLSSLPAGPGVYHMLDRRGEILYIGKAKNLRERVCSYFRAGTVHTRKITEMVKRVRSIEVEETGSELGALLQESREIKEQQPKYNTLQKRYHRYAFLRLDSADPYPRIGFAMEIAPDGAEYFGPFRNRYAVESVIETINHAFDLRECDGRITPDSDTIPCMYHQIGRCGAPCADQVSSEQYAVEVERVRAFLCGSEGGIVTLLEEKMNRHAERLEFEEAATIRNRIGELRQLFKRQERIADSVNGNNVIIVLPAAERGEREIFLIRFGRLAARLVVGSRTPEAKLRRLIERTYHDGSSAPPHCRKEEIDEIQIIAAYLNQYRDSGKFIWVEQEESVGGIVERVAGALRRRAKRSVVGTELDLMVEAEEFDAEVASAL